MVGTFSPTRSLHHQRISFYHWIRKTDSERPAKEQCTRFVLSSQYVLFGRGILARPFRNRVGPFFSQQSYRRRLWNLVRLGEAVVPIRALLEENSGVFGPGELLDIAKAFEAVLKDMGLTDRTDPATLMLAKLTIELAKQGQFTAASLRARVMREMKPKGRLN